MPVNAGLHMRHDDSYTKQLIRFTYMLLSLKQKINQINLQKKGKWAYTGHTGNSSQSGIILRSKYFLSLFAAIPENNYGNRGSPSYSGVAFHEWFLPFWFTINKYTGHQEKLPCQLSSGPSCIETLCLLFLLLAKKPPHFQLMHSSFASTTTPQFVCLEKKSQGPEAKATVDWG